LVLSGTVDQELSLRTAALAHQYLVKPCDAKTLRSRVEGALNLRGILEDPSLRKAVSKLHALPSIPAIYIKLLGALRSPDVSARAIGELVAQDMGMTAKVLQLANSAVIGISRRITTPTEAVVYLGVDRLRALSLSASVLAQFHPNALPGFSIEALQDHSLKVGTVARGIATSLDWPDTEVDDAFVGGLLHDTGKLVLAENCPELYREALTRAKEEAIPIREAELAVFGTTHAEVGGYLLWLWGLSDAVTEAAARHHRPPAEPRTTPVPAIAVHVADAVVNRRLNQDVDRECLRRLGLLDQLSEWEAQGEELLARTR